ncbi:UDP-4-amino-4,6-dideoxy-N-acetyl-beta-L-altrosamine transaminase [Maridesulfovibrio hydrothermalis]|uniref:Spore coat polysaccharide biosynthesis protein spsC n=1 Tax=Maridesulfovibrio hydrothermalis AM13 = DSM 14728 TaxID=1121451 RepID=L0R9Y9_9BACT|nr:UDP-4-amino-4,6-dideoxy-N-acetyl-beta-L-altrosamine transaminase [Maridesulfovibrio hydrothermalis]CCO23598.1 Spore coat polysaccharide biosynthesis protein spsC [Maridesulfovibrio hydrothermalis AM13 = DSM 14728]
MIPYGKHIIDDDDIAEVVKVLKSDWLTTGPAVTDFEKAVADYTGCGEAVAVSSGTAALHAAMYSLEIKPGDEVIVPPITFAASANCVVYMGATPVFADVEAETLLIDPAAVEQQITPATKAVVAVDYAGQTCDYDSLKNICKKNGIVLVGDCCHAIGAKDEHGRKAGAIADISVFSFHPVKHITTGEGGMVLTDNPELAQKARIFRNHGINLDASARSEKCTWVYDMQELGYNYRITDLQCALGISQLKKLDKFLQIRRDLATCYDRILAKFPEVTPLRSKEGIEHAYHLYAVRIPASRRKAVFEFMRGEKIGVNVHYIPVHYHPYYQEHFKTKKGLCPVAESAYEQLLTLPLHPAMDRKDVKFITDKLDEALKNC